MRVLLVDCDTLRADHLGCYGYHRATSPNVDRIAADGVRFTRCYTSDAPCLPSRTALWYGRVGVHTGVAGHAGTAARIRYPGDGHATDPQRLPLTTALARAGIRCTTFSTFAQRHLAWHFYAGWSEIRRFSDKNGSEDAHELEGPAVEWLRANGRADGWLLHLNFWDPHTIYTTPEEYGNPFAGDPPPEYPHADALAAAQESYGYLGARDVVASLPPSPRHPDAIDGRDGFKTWIDGYDTGIRYFDDALGRILDTIAELGVLDETAVIVTADHGENHGELNLYGAHTTADQPTCNVPLVVRWPGLTKAGAVCEDLAYQLDLAPTLTELLGAETPARWDGRSLVAALRGDDLPQPREYLVVGQGTWYVQRAVVTRTHLYARTLHRALDPIDRELLFDLEHDPHEEHNLAEREPATAAALARLIEEWWAGEAPEAGSDPLLTICAEGGPYYPRMWRDDYLRRLRDTGRGWAADELEARSDLSGVVDWYDFTRF
jgi:arylsulfatase A-like enzyme